MRSSKKIRCASCGGTIRKHEPDLILRDLKNAGPSRYFHTRCGEAAYTKVMSGPGLYRMTVRHVEEAAN